MVACMAKTAHALWPDGHGHHHARPVCDRGGHTKGLHLHDARFHPDDCSLCAFTLAKAEVPPAPFFYILPICFPEIRLHTPGRVFGTDQPTDLSRRRGPPALFMPYPV